MSIHSFKQIVVNAEAIRNFSESHEEFAGISNESKKGSEMFIFYKKLIATNISVVNGKWKLSAHVKYF